MLFCIAIWKKENMFCFSMKRTTEFKFPANGIVELGRNICYFAVASDPNNDLPQLGAMMASTDTVMT